MQKELADFAIKYLEKKGVNYAEARLEQHENTSFLLKNNNLEGSSFSETSGIAIRFIINNSLGFCTLNQLEKAKIKSLLNKSILTTKKSKISEKIQFSKSTADKKSYKVKQKINIKDYSPEEKLKILKDLDKSINHLPSRFLDLNDSIVKKYYTDTEGTKIESEIPHILIGYYITLKHNNKSTQRYFFHGSSSGYEILKKWNLNKNIKEEAEALQNNLKNGIKPPKGKIDLILAPEITGIAVHESVGHPFEADRILGREAAQAGESFITQEMLGKKISSDCITVIDDPTIPNSSGFYLFDDEGIQAKERILIKNGKINEFLHNRESSFKMNLQSNSSARADNYDVEPLVRMANTYLKPGSFKEEELIEDVKLGIYMKSFSEWNIDDKRYQQKYVGNEAYLIKNGKITSPLISPALEITTPAFWSSIDACAKNLKFFYGPCGKGERLQTANVWMGGPSIRLRNIQMS